MRGLASNLYGFGLFLMFPDGNIKYVIKENRYISIEFLIDVKKQV